MGGVGCGASPAGHNQITGGCAVVTGLVGKRRRDLGLASQIPQPGGQFVDAGLHRDASGILGLSGPPELPDHLPHPGRDPIGVNSETLGRVANRGTGTVG